MPRNKQQQKSPKGSGLKHVTTEVILVSDWIDPIKYRVNPRQRNTELRMNRKHLRRLNEAVHYIVAAAQIIGTDVRIILDGHSRGAKWRSDPESIEQNTLTLLLFHVETEADAKRLYDMFDSKDAVETAPDKVFGAFREVGYEPQSSLLKGAQISTACFLAYACIHGIRQLQDAYAEHSTNDMIKYFLPQLKELDAFMFSRPSRSRKGANSLKMGLNGPMVTAFLLISYSNESHRNEFWTAFKDGCGNKRGTRRDGVQILTDFLMTKSKDGQDNYTRSMRLVAIALRAFKQYQNDDWFVHMPSPIDPHAYMGNRPILQSLIDAARKKQTEDDNYDETYEAGSGAEAQVEMRIAARARD